VNGAGGVAVDCSDRSVECASITVTVMMPAMEMARIWQRRSGRRR
jgi:hypothetical protein